MEPSPTATKGKAPASAASPAAATPAPTVPIAIVLAAGASARMGYPKALASVHGEPALSRVVRILREAGVLERIVVLGSRAEDVRSRCEMHGARVVVNEDWERGRTSSLKVGLLGLKSMRRARPGERLVIAPVDRPLFEPDDIRALIADPRPIVVPTHAGSRGHPIVIDRSLEPEILALKDDEPLSNVVGKDPTRVAEVARENAGVLFNLDTPEDAERVAKKPGSALDAAPDEKSPSNGAARGRALKK